MAVNAADDERNPPELGVMERELKRIRNARLLLIPGSADTFGLARTAMRGSGRRRWRSCCGRRRRLAIDA